MKRPPQATACQWETLATYLATGGSMARTAATLGISRSTAKRHLADLRARFGLSTEQLVYVGRAARWLEVPALEPDVGSSTDRVSAR